jgi:uncharacterized protein (DUF1499 family)
MLNYLVLGLLGAVVALGVYVRLVPSKPSVWHQTFLTQPPGQRQSAGGFQIVLNAPAPEATLQQLDALILATPRTTRLAGSPEEGMTTYITRSRVFGFPDYTTVWAGPDDTEDGGHGPLLKIEGRLRFGKSDMGGNRARIEGWLTQLSEAQR